MKTAILYQRDCLAVMDAMPAKKYSLIFADPPYSTGGNTRNRGRRTARADWQALQEICVKAGIQPRGSHALRRTTASLLNEIGIPTATRAQILGHSSGYVTDAHYTRAGSTETATALTLLSDRLA